jgi:hypothetical protein
MGLDKAKIVECVLLDARFEAHAELEATEEE